MSFFALVGTPFDEPECSTRARRRLAGRTLTVLIGSLIALSFASIAFLVILRCLLELAQGCLYYRKE